MIQWVTTEYTETKANSASEKDAWALLVRLLQGQFRELRLVRNTAGNVTSTWLGNKQAGCAQVIWASLRAHRLMKEFLVYNISGHPKLAPYVLKHLARSAATKDSLTAAVLKINKEVAAAKKAHDAQAQADRNSGKK